MKVYLDNTDDLFYDYNQKYGVVFDPIEKKNYPLYFVPINDPVLDHDVELDVQIYTQNSYIDKKDAGPLCVYCDPRLNSWSDMPMNKLTTFSQLIEDEFKRRPIYTKEGEHFTVVHGYDRYSPKKAMTSLVVLHDENVNPYMNMYSGPVIIKGELGLPLSRDLCAYFLSHTRLLRSEYELGDVDETRVNPPTRVTIEVAMSVVNNIMKE